MIAVKTRRDVLDVVQTTGVVAVIRLQDAGAVREVASALADGGVRAIEVTMTVPGAVEIIAALAAAAPEAAVIGAGTVMTGETAKRVIDAGAAFVVSPVFRPDVVATCRAAGVAVMPGAFSPLEIVTASEGGADVVKVFPATALGPAYIRDLLGPMPLLRLLPTGGITAENAGGWIRAGALAVGAGSALVDGATVAARRFDTLTGRARAFVDAVRAARGGGPS